ncbi:MAG: nicotinate-nucleotide adenylyltransferase [Pseudomonadota bacterium]
MKGRGPVGLFGGSFNPPHLGHRALVLHAQRRLGLNRVRVLVSPQNPLKSADVYGSLDERLDATRAVMRGITGVRVEPEAENGPAYAVDTIARALSQAGGAPLVYLLGADSFAGLHRWKAWTSIMEALPIAVINRPGERLAAVKSPAGRRYASSRVPEREALSLPHLKAPAWCFLTGVNQDVSSSEIRLHQNPL